MTVFVLVVLRFHLRKLRPVVHANKAIKPGFY